MVVGSPDFWGVDAGRELCHSETLSLKPYPGPRKGLLDGKQFAQSQNLIEKAHLESRPKAKSEEKAGM